MHAAQTHAAPLKGTDALGNRGNAERVVNRIDGAVRTIQCLSSAYCPTHGAERDQRSFAAITRSSPAAHSPQPVA
jgi:hypothetical protein